jgi:hypothetical protein
MAQEFCIGCEKRFQTLPGGFIRGLYLFTAHAKGQNFMQLSDVPKGLIPLLESFRQRISGPRQITVLLLNVPHKPG